MPLQARCWLVFGLQPALLARAGSVERFEARRFVRPHIVVVTLLASSSPATLAVPATGASFHGTALRIAGGVVLLLAVLAPFEIPLITLTWPPLVVTSLEVVLVGALAAGAGLYLADPRRFVWRTPVTAPGVALGAAFGLAASFAPQFPGNAFRFTARFLAAGLVALLVINVIRTAASARRLVASIVTIAAIVGAVAVLEAAEVTRVMQALTWFRPGFHVVGGQVRATSTLGYPTTASMCLEVAFAWGLWLLVSTVESGARRSAAAIFVALCVVAAGVVATFTRAGLISLAVSLAIVGGLRVAKLGRFDRAQIAIGLLALAVLGAVLVSRSPSRLVARWSTEGSQAWYGAQYEVPSTLRFVPGGRYRVPIAVTNTGRLAWRSDETPPFALSYHWVAAGSRHVAEFNGRRTPFVDPVQPGERAELRAVVIAPTLPGWYELVWDVVHERRAWLSTEGVRPARTAVRVDGPPATRSGDVMAELPPTAVRPDRRSLWGAALALAAAHPLLGVGPDNFRLSYGPHLGLATWDRRVHANNLYLEVLAGAGVIGLAALLWIVAAAGLSLWQRWRAAPAATATAAAAAIAVWTAIAGHGLVDTFLAFTPTYVMFAIAAGLAFSPGSRDCQPQPSDRAGRSPSPAPPAAHAHRV